MWVLFMIDMLNCVQGLNQAILTLINSVDQKRIEAKLME